MPSGKPRLNTPCYRWDFSAKECLCLHSNLMKTTSNHKKDDENAFLSDKSLSVVLLHGSWNHDLSPALSDEDVSEHAGKEEIEGQNRRETTKQIVMQQIAFAFSAARDWAVKLSREQAGTDASIARDILEYADCRTIGGSMLVDSSDDETIDIAVDQFLAPEDLPALVVVANGDVGSPEALLHPVRGLDSRTLGAFLSTPSSEPTYNEASFTVLNALRDTLRNIFEGRPADAGGGEAGKTKTGPSLEGETEALRIFVSGDRSQVGKSSVCMGLIGTLVHDLGYPPSSLAYIKPATQCEATQLVALYCEELGVSHRAIGPIVYYKGFTRAFLAGDTAPSEVLLEQAGEAVDAIAEGKRIVIVDGVGYPAVGSICGTDNASVAAACGPIQSQTSQGQGRRPPVPVLLVGKKGVGDAVDSFNLNATYFESRGVPVLGSVFNRLPLEGYYSLDNCKQAVGSYFEQKTDKIAFGFIPEVASISSSREEGAALELESAKEFVKTFADHVDVNAIVEAAAKATAVPVRKIMAPPLSHKNLDQRTHQPITRVVSEESPTKRPNTEARDRQKIRLTRAQVEEAAKIAGAAGG
ncbi:unnamed protein product [Pseudo-nitzschia multistriata]|uniref:DRTGG domain-containing protein n=1 Tax=Pseudo-nitzschia multistriata TaxID=183589 RepID=A0A448ZE30_9STRA|nr:unnamed protein product [Pseudo-nitzschia multistriata]